MKKIWYLILSVFIFCLIVAPVSARADGFNMDDLTALKELNEGVTNMALMINVASSKMMKFADMLVCNSIHGAASYFTFSVPGIISVSVHIISIDIFISGCILYILGFFIMMMASYYMFDVAFNLAIALVMLPLGLALWPFGWTKDKLKPLIEGIVYYVGVFIFLPLGILIGVKLVENIVTEALGGMDYETAFYEDKSDLIKDNLGVFTLGFLKILLCYIVAMRIIPLMAVEFCQHFFGEALVGNPINEKITQALSILKDKTIGRASKYAGDVAKHQTGKAIQNLGDKNGNVLERSMHSYGKNLAKTK